MTVLLTDEVRALLGNAVTYVAPEPLSRASIRYFALAIGADPQRWVDEAPPTLICETTQLTGRSEPDEHGYLGHGWKLPLPVPCAVFRGGNDYRFYRPARYDDRIRTVWKLTEAVERADRGGEPILFVTAEAEYSAVSSVEDGDAGELLATNVETLIYRPVGKAPQARAEPPRSESGAEPSTTEDTLPPLVRRIELADMVAYGAATWDWHRLHYDAEHAQRLGAAAPLVDGQMLGALLADYVLRFGGPEARLTRLSFRNRSPVLCGETVTLSGTVGASFGDALSIDLQVSVGSRVAVAPANAKLEID